MLNVLGLVGQLEAGGTHAVVHGIHVDLAWVRFTFSGDRRLSVLVLVQRDLDLDLLSTALPNRLGKAEETRVGTRGLLRDELLASAVVGFWHVALASGVDVSTDFFIK